MNPASIASKALRRSAPQQLRPFPHSHNRREIWESEGPSYGGLSNARSLATLAACVMNPAKGIQGVRLVGEQTMKTALEPLETQIDAVVKRNVTFSTGGWGLGIRFPTMDEAKKVEWVGWGGVGGSLVYWNAELGIAFSYVPNTMGFTSMGDRRSWRLLNALLESFNELN